MHAHTTSRRLGLLCLAACLLSSPAWTQDRWYRVELLVFSHEDGGGAEEWKALPTLAYPPEARFLVYPGRVAERLEKHGGDSRLDEFGRQVITLAGSEDIPLKPAGMPAAADRDAVAPELTDTAADDEESLPAYPTPFIALPHARRSLHGKSAYMQRTGRFRTLFHETWVQPVKAESEALPLVLDDSGALQDWPRLQGTVKLHLSRYLHIETNLWLNTPGEYLPGDWRMPAPPLGPPSIIIEEPEPPLVAEAESYYISNPLPVPRDPMDPNDITVEESGPVYPWRHAVLMQQNRRMRSNEIHYLDHPLLGVVVEITPLDEAQLAAMAAAEAAGDDS